MIDIRYRNDINDIELHASRTLLMERLELPNAWRACYCTIKEWWAGAVADRRLPVRSTRYSFASAKCPLPEVYYCHATTNRSDHQVAFEAEEGVTRVRIVFVTTLA